MTLVCIMLSKKKIQSEKCYLSRDYYTESWKGQNYIKKISELIYGAVFQKLGGRELRMVKHKDFL